MNRESKVQKVGELQQTFSRAKFAAVADYQGLKVTELEKLRISLRQQNAQLQVAKNTLLKIAAKDTAYEGLQQDFSGTTVVAFGFEEPVGPAKALAEFTKNFEKLKIRSAMFEGQRMSAEQMIALSKLPSKEQLLGQLCGVLAAVPTKLVRTFNAAPSNLVYALQAIKEQKEQQEN
ncbi:50S ribosomal protein L10 [Candidatus Electronema sp. PJ]|uniref:50S ribosomal protein L10 n=1 Tax=Candidatus Electronema sp. PJ TaxID=3401572 RepID=UPI003AA89A7F